MTGDGGRARRVQPAKRTPQTQLTLPFPNTWGGRRAGAGRKPGSGRSRMRHASRPNHRASEPVFVTLRSELGSLRSPFVFPTILRGVRDFNERWEGRFRIVHFSVQTDHLHLMVEASTRGDLLAGVRGFSISIAGTGGRCGRRGQSGAPSSICSATSESTGLRAAIRSTRVRPLPTFPTFRSCPASDQSSAIRASLLANCVSVDHPSATRSPGFCVTAGCATVSSPSSKPLRPAVPRQKLHILRKQRDAPARHVRKRGPGGATRLFHAVPDCGLFARITRGDLHQCRFVRHIVFVSRRRPFGPPNCHLHCVRKHRPQLQESLHAKCVAIRRTQRHRRLRQLHRSRPIT
jgi:hypothetical protein